MNVWSLTHRSKTVLFYHQSNSVIQTQRRFRIHFHIARRGRIPSRNTILSWVNKFADTATLVNVKHGAPRTVNTPENAERIRDALQRSPRRSLRQQASILAISRRSVQRMVHAMHFHPYKIQIVQKILPQDKLARLQFSNTMLRMLQDEPDLINKLLMSDEAHFHLSGFVNKQDMRYWSQVNPKKIHEKPLHSPKVTVWCGIGTFGVVGPYFFENDAGVAVTINAERYVAMLQNFLPQEFERLRVNRRDLYFQQDGATCHTARLTMEHLRNQFRGLISRLGDIPWPARSPDLTPPDFFLWGYLKQRVYVNRPATIEDLKQAIRNEIAAIDEDLLRRVFQNFEVRLRQCVVQEGGHLTDLIFKK